MRVSELKYELLTEEDMINLIMSDIKDYDTEIAAENEKCESIIVLGCAPRPLHSRLRKGIKLFDQGFSNNLIVTGGNGWHRLMTADPKKEDIYFDYIKEHFTNIGPFESFRIMMYHFEYWEEKFKEMFGEDYIPWIEKYRKTSLGWTESDIAKHYPTIEDAKDLQVYYEKESTNTPENASNTKVLLESLYERDEKEDVPLEKRVNRTKRIMVITIPYHCRRTYLTFKKYFPEYEILVTPATRSTDYRKEDVFGEAKKIIEYTRNGSIADLELSEFLDPEIVSEIESHQGYERSIRN